MTAPDPGTGPGADPGPGVGYRIAVDVGGTFTDLVLRRPDGTQLVHKTSSTPEDPTVGFVAGLHALAAAEGREVRDLLAGTDLLVHGTTITTNALLTGTGARTGLLTTEGLRDVILARQGSRDDQFASKAAPPPPLVPRHLIETVRERVDSTGTVVTPLYEQDVRRAAGRFRAAGVEAVAVSFLFSYLAPDHERRAAEILEAELPGVFVTASCRLVPEVRLFERTTTTALNAYVGPILRGYTERLARRLADLGYRRPVLVLQSNGGVVSLPRAAERAVETLLSGPAGGPAAVAPVLAALGLPQAMAMDMGGTSFEVSLSRRGRTETTSQGVLGGHSICLPILDIATIGAGGGSVAWATAGGMLRVGPRSAGARPGPASYGRGGTEPTVTDADLLLGYLDEAAFSDGIRLSRAAAASAVGALAERLGIGLTEAAAGIHRTVNAAMADRLRLSTVRRGLDPRRFALVAAGGAGPSHAVEMARELGVPLVVVPGAASVLCARGMLHADLVRYYVHSFAGRDPHPPATVLEQALNGLVQQAEADLREQGATGAVSYTRFADVRYVGQVHEISVAFADGTRPDAAAVADLLARFHLEHEERYGYAQPELAVEFVNVRLLARAPAAPPSPSPPRRVSGAAVPIARRQAWFEGGYREVDVYDLETLPAHRRVEGPALFAHPTTTLVVPPGFVAELADDGSALVHPATEALDAVLDRLRRGADPRPAVPAGAVPAGAVAIGAAP
ncbi:hydantoinase/oxoprolinase family protein [Frankia sp. Cpl3]|nr:hydantoinase/oxoprolinase family protein [Parafrankia colletiae]MCK9901942.1 hydantoinase/oxoprolinase family protein [Frankia sp. Cpl3]